MAQLVFRKGPFAGQTRPLPASRAVTLGRNPDADLSVPDGSLSRRHCAFEPGPPGYILRDLGSTNGTYLNGVRVQGEAILSAGDYIVLGDTAVEFVAEDAAPAAEAAAPAAVAASPAPPAPPAAQAPPERPTQPGPLPSALREAPRNLAAALAEMDQPLPEEPDPDAVPALTQTQLTFCDVCDRSIALVEVALGICRQDSGKQLCLDCLSRVAPVVASRIPDMESGAFSGRLETIDVPRMLSMLEPLGLSGVMVIRDKEQELGRIHFVKGAVWHAQSEGKQGHEALSLLFTKRSGTFKFGPMGTPPQRTVMSNTMSLLLEHMRQVDEGERSAGE